MKTIKLFTTLMAVAIVAIATAVERPKMIVTPISPDRALVSIENENAALFELSIYATNGDLVYYKQSAEVSNNYQKVFDFKNLETGNYTMKLRVNDTRLSKNFEVQANGIVVDEESELRFDPYFDYANNVLKLSYLNFDGEPLKIKFYDEGELIYQSSLGKNFDVQAGYDLTSLESGKYDVVLTSSSNKFSFSLEK
ncbi:MAG: hypothetical protein JXR61_12190 [Prolixibacteraceae bacterium]|nr:hypothetical protein [Prolixibacteraceae bacterium]